MKKLFNFSKSDINSGTIYNAYRWNSISPERRVKNVQDGYVQFMQSVNDEFGKYVTDENKQEMESDLNYFKTGYIERKTKQLNAQSKTASSMVTGPSKFNTRSNRKKLNTEHRCSTELLEWSEKTLKKLRAKYNPKVTGIIRSDDNAAIKKLENKLKSLITFQELMKNANRLCKSKLDNEQKVEMLTGLGLTDEQAKELLIPSKLSGNIGFASLQLSNNNATIRNTKKRLEQLKKMDNWDKRWFKGVLLCKDCLGGDFCMICSEEMVRQWNSRFEIGSLVKVQGKTKAKTISTAQIYPTYKGATVFVDCFRVGISLTCIQPSLKCDFGCKKVPTRQIIRDGRTEHLCLNCLTQLMLNDKDE